jgi:adenosylcobinamide-GDP ribazoletransferase
MIDDFFRAVGFLTILPCPERSGTVEDFGRISGWFPVVGAVLGVMLWLAAFFLNYIFPFFVVSGLTVMLWAFLTRGFHLDGLADTFDGIGGGFDRESRLAIMKDSRLGTFGGVSISAMLLLKIAALAGTRRLFPALLLAPVLGRWAILFAMKFFPSARPGGMGDTFRKGCGKNQVKLSSIFVFWAIVLSTGYHGLPLLLLIPAAALLFSRWLRSLLGGLTGDSYGAVCEIGELLVLLFFAIDIEFRIHFF